MQSVAPPVFVHLRLHTEYSLQDSVVRIPELVERTAQLGMPAVAVTDQNNLFAMVKFYREALQQGVKPIIGVDVLLRGRGERAQPTRLTLLCKDPRGYQNVANLVTRAWLEGQDRGVPLIERSWLDADTHGRADRALRRRRRRCGPRHPDRARGRRAHAGARVAERCSAIVTTSNCSASAAPTTRPMSPGACP